MSDALLVTQAGSCRKIVMLSEIILLLPAPSSSLFYGNLPKSVHRHHQIHFGSVKFHLNLLSNLSNVLNSCIHTEREGRERKG